MNRLALLVANLLAAILLAATPQAAALGGQRAALLVNANQVSDYTAGVLPADTVVTRASAGTRLNASCVLVSETTNVARLTYTWSGGACVAGGLLNEPQRTNRVLRSEEFGNATWDVNHVTVSSDVLAAPDGATTADKIIETAVNDFHGKGNQTTYALGSAQRTLSAYLKPAERSWVGLELYNAVGASTVDTAWFNVSTGAIGTVQSEITAVLRDAGGGWYRPSVTRTSTLTFIGIGLTPSDGSSSYLGDNTKGMYYWGAQLEDGPDASSYIPTTSAAVTRSADVTTIARRNGVYVVDIYRQNGVTRVTAVAVTAGTYTVPTDVSPVQRIKTRRVN